jgi:hypothetical protein
MAKLIVTSHDGAEERPFRYDDRFALESTAGPDRLVIGVAQRPVRLMLELAERAEGPFHVLYVLLESRSGHEPARYQAPFALMLHEAREFFLTYERFLERDGRHHAWIFTDTDHTMLIYEQHDILFAYGPLTRFVPVLERRGLKRGPVRVPASHRHVILPEHDRDEAQLLRHWDWVQSPLLPGDQY